MFKNGIFFISLFFVLSCYGVNAQTSKGAAYSQNENSNWTSSVTYDITGQITSSGVTYFDKLGKKLQSQTSDILTGRIWVNQVLYDSQGRPAFQTLGAPVTANDAFYEGYKSNFITSDLSTFNIDNITDDSQNLPIVSTSLNTLGWYYSTNNTDEPYQDITSNPYSKTIYSTLNPGKVLKNLGGNKVTVDGEEKWLSGFTYTVPAPQEMYYVFGLAYFDDAETLDDEEIIVKVNKTVVIDVHGNETVVFTDTDGKTLAAAKSGGTNKYEIISLIGEQGFVDVHIPKGITNSEITFLTSDTYTIYDLRSEKKINKTDMTGGSLYRISLSPQQGAKTYVNRDKGRLSTSLNAKGLRYPVNYYDYSLNYYDMASRLTKSVQPLGFDDSFDIVRIPQHTMFTTFKYNALGQLIEATSPDEGTAKFKYRQDGQIRYSQNSKQSAASSQEFSYTNYDELGRPKESGVLESISFDTADPDDVLPSGTKKEQHSTSYDYLEQSDLDFLETINATYHNPSFLSGNVAKTSNENSSTYYSYDVYGRVEWIVQDIDGLGVKTIDYEYDPVTSQVVKVDFQKYSTNNERFIHKYTYNVVGQLIQVETSTNETSFTNQAKYDYYETGALKRTEIADDLQGIDYVYNLAGQLKSINHPDLSSTSVPGNDVVNGFNQDLFGMKIDYYNGDYLRDLQNIAGTDKGLNQFNGNIKAIIWNTDSNNDGLSQQNSYYYKYNKDNWLTDASFNLPLYSGFDNFTETWDWKDFVNTSLGGGSSVTLTLENNTLTYYYNAGFAATTIKTGPIKQINDPVPDTDLGFIEVKEDGSTTFDNDRFKAKVVSGWLVIEAVDYADKYRLFTGMKAINISASAQGGDPVVDQSAEYNVYDITYDANGNIKTLNRNREDGVINMDKFTYNYKYNTNQLSHVDDVVLPSSTNDLDDQDLDNYIYNEIGQLTSNNGEGISYTYNVSGLVTEVKKNGITLVKFYYDDKGKRVRKETYSSGSLAETTHYVRDAAGSVMAIYTDGDQKELPIYGSSRLGVYFRDVATVYQLTDHLGNVRALISKQDQQQPLTGFTDYYPFGMPMPNRNNQSAEGYRYAFQEQEKDPETGKEAFQLRLWDSRIARWTSPDPYGQFYSPYLGMGNNPINGVDPDGGCWKDGEKCADGAIGDTMVGDNGATWTMGENGWNTDAFDSYGVDFSQSFEPNFNEISSGLFLGSTIITGFERSIDEFIKTNNFNNLTIPKELRYLKQGTRYLGNLANAIDIGSDSYNYFLAEGISLKRYSYRMTGSALAFYAGSAASLGTGFVVGSIFKAGESYYDAIQFDRAYNIEVRASDIHIDMHGNIIQNEQNFSVESMIHSFGGN